MVVVEDALIYLDSMIAIGIIDPVKERCYYTEPPSKSRWAWLSLVY